MLPISDNNNHYNCIFASDTLLFKKQIYYLYIFVLYLTINIQYRLLQARIFKLPPREQVQCGLYIKCKI